MNYRTSSELKAMAREKLKGKYGISIGVFLVYSIIAFAATFITGFFYNEKSIMGMVVYMLISLIISLLTAVLSVGIIKFFMNINRDEEYKVSDLFWGFTNHPDKCIVLTILILLISFVLMLPMILFITAYAVTGSTFMLLFSVLFIILGMVAEVVVMLKFSVAYMVLIDNVSLSVIEILKESDRLMRGNKGRYFYIQLSFIGLMLLSILSCGIAMLWIQPYMQSTVTYFYMEINNELDRPRIDLCADDTTIDYM